jgi:hypothetical protein
MPKHTLECLLLGEKSPSIQLAIAYANGQFVDSVSAMQNSLPTLQKRSIAIGEQTVELTAKPIEYKNSHIHNTQRIFSSNSESYAVFLVYDSSDLHSFNRLQQILKSVNQEKSHLNKPVDIFVVGVHTDDLLPIAQEQVNSFAKENSLAGSFTTNLSENSIVNASEPFITAAKYCAQRLQPTAPELKQEKNILAKLTQYQNTLEKELQVKQPLNRLFSNSRTKQAKLDFVTQLIQNIKSHLDSQSGLETINTNNAIDILRLTINNLSNREGNQASTFAGKSKLNSIFSGLLSHRCLDLVSEFTQRPSKEISKLLTANNQPQPTQPSNSSNSESHEGHPPRPTRR